MTLLTLLAGGKRRGVSEAGIIDVEQSMTIRRSAEDLYRAIREPKTMNVMMEHFAEIRTITESRARWTVPGPIRTLDWEAHIVHDHPGELVEWESVPGAAIRFQLSARFRPAPRDWGTVTTLRLRVEPGSTAMRGVAKLLGGMLPTVLLSKALRRFKSLVETGEVPTTHRQPAARNGGRDT